MNTTRMYPQSMREAFPHDYQYHSANDSAFNRQHRDEIVVIAICAASLIGLAVMAWCGVLPGGGAV